MTDRELTADQARPPRAQRAPAILMVRPAAFGWNAETSDSNRFQTRTAPDQPEIAAAALAEFERAAASLRDAGVSVHVVEDRPEPRCPDAVFPNNWVSFHHDGSVVLYPMLAPTRRRERPVEQDDAHGDCPREGGQGTSATVCREHEVPRRRGSIQDDARETAQAGGNDTGTPAAPQAPLPICFDRSAGLTRPQMVSPLIGK